MGRVTWHQFRHIHSSLLNHLNVPVKIAQEQLGHASISTTLNIYTHVVDASHRRAVEDVEQRLSLLIPAPRRTRPRREVIVAGKLEQPRMKPIAVPTRSSTAWSCQLRRAALPQPAVGVSRDVVTRCGRTGVRRRRYR